MGLLYLGLGLRYRQSPYAVCAVLLTYIIPYIYHSVKIINITNIPNRKMVGISDNLT